MPQLSDGKTTTSNNKVKGVQLEGINGQNYSSTSKVTVKNTTKDKYEYQVMTNGTNQNINLEQGKYSVTNNSGGTINYTWI